MVTKTISKRVVEDRRGRPRVRRDINDLIRTPEGKASEAKLCSVAGKGILAYILVEYAAVIVNNWDVLAIIALFLIAPDLIKKLLEMRYGAMTGKKGV